MNEDIIVFDGKFGMEFTQNNGRFIYDESWAQKQISQIKSLKGRCLSFCDDIAMKNASLFDYEKLTQGAQRVCSHQIKPPLNNGRQRG